MSHDASKQDSTGQVSLGDISYDGRTVEPPADSRVTGSPETTADLQDCTAGDILWLAGTEYVVVEKETRLFGPSPLLVAGENGQTGRLAGGTLSTTSNCAGVAWVDTLAATDDPPSLDDLICQFDHVYRLERDQSDRLYDWVPQTAFRKCPDCEETGKPLATTVEDGQSQEIRKCTECKDLYQHIRDIPDGDSATILTYDGSTITPVEITGPFRRVRQDKMKFPIDTNKGRNDGIVTTDEVAMFVNSRVLPSPFKSLFTTPTPAYDQIRSELQNHLDPTGARNVIDSLTTAPECPEQDTTHLVGQVMDCLDDMDPNDMLQCLDFEPFGVVEITTDSVYPIKPTIPGASRTAKKVIWKDDAWDTNLQVVHYQLPDGYGHDPA